MNLFSEISARGYLDSTTHPELVPILNEKKICFYVGFDPSSDSFHLVLQKAGHSPICNWRLTGSILRKRSLKYFKIFFSTTLAEGNASLPYALKFLY